MTAKRSQEAHGWCLRSPKGRLIAETFTIASQLAAPSASSFLMRFRWARTKKLREATTIKEMRIGVREMLGSEAKHHGWTLVRVRLEEVK